MSTQVSTLDEFHIESAIGLDSFGASFVGRSRNSDMRVMVLGVDATSQPNLKLTGLQQALRGVFNVERENIAPLLGYGLLDDTTRAELNAHMIQALPPLSDPPPLHCYLIYKLDATPLMPTLSTRSESARIRLVGELIEGLGALHQKRAYHLTLTPNALWMTSEGVLKITHCGVSALLKTRGLSLNRDVNQTPSHVGRRLSYASPEEVGGKLTNHICDLYSVACLTHEIFVEPLLDAATPIDELRREVLSGISAKVSPQLSAEWSSFISRGVHINVRERFTSSQLMLRAFNDLRSISVMGSQATSRIVDSSDGDPQSETAESDLQSETAESDLKSETAESDLQSEMAESDLQRETAESDLQRDTAESDLQSETVESEALESELMENQLDFTMNDEPYADDSNATSEAMRPASTGHALEARRLTPDVSSSSDASMSLAINSLRSQLSQHPSPPLNESVTSESAEDIDELAFGATVQDDEMSFGFSQDDADERTFLEYSDVDEKTVFEDDLPNQAQYATSTEFGLPSIDLQTPDFLGDDSVDLEPSRVLPLPNRAQFHGPSSPHLSPQGGAGSQSNALAQHAAPQVQVPSSSATLDVVTSSPSPHSYPPSHNASLSSPVESYQAPQPPLNPEATPALPSAHYMSSAQEWPGNEELQAYTPPEANISKQRPRRAPKLKQQESAGKRFISLIVPLMLSIIGGVGIYWASSHWEQVSKVLSGMVTTESATHLQIVSSPPDMTVWINGRPHKKTPTIFHFEENFSVGGSGFAVGDEVKLKFVWRDKRRRRGHTHRTKIKVLAGESNLYFVSSPQRKMKYAQTFIRSPQESLHVSIAGQQVGRTPLIIIGPKGQTLNLEFSGDITQEKRTLKLGELGSDEVVFNAPISPSASE